jgi:hypothetical protein
MTTTANMDGPRTVPEEKEWSKEAITKEEIKDRFQSFLESDKPGIAHFFEGDLSKYIEKAETMAAAVNKKGCRRETALELSLLALYDVVLLVGKLCFDSCGVLSNRCN